MTDIVILPGIGGSGELHWQTRWQKNDPTHRRFLPTDWNRPELEDWISALDRAVGAAPNPPLLVAHSLACLLVAHWQQISTAPVAGAFLVAVPNPQSQAFPVAAKVLPIRHRANSGFPHSSSRVRTIHMARSNMPTEERANGEAASWK
jgi:predicted alpha/beta hydrolase family esterase